MLYCTKEFNINILKKFFSDNNINLSSMNLLEYRIKFSTLVWVFPELIKNEYYPSPNDVNMMHENTFNQYFKKYNNFNFLYFDYLEIMIKNLKFFCIVQTKKFHL